MHLGHLAKFFEKKILNKMGNNCIYLRRSTQSVYGEHSEITPSKGPVLSRDDF